MHVPYFSAFASTNPQANTREYQWVMGRLSPVSLCVHRCAETNFPACVCWYIELKSEIQQHLQSRIFHSAVVTQSEKKEHFHVEL